MRLLERTFRVGVPVADAWAHLADVERWPSWARHIRRVELEPQGALTPLSKGTIRLSNGVRSTFRMEELDEHRNWKWAGPFLWLLVHYDHRFRPVGPAQTEIRFTLDADGFGVAFFGRLFAALYARNLDRAIPRLIAELESA